MKNKGLIISLVVFAGILVMLLVTIFLINFPDSSAKDFLRKKTTESVRPTIEENAKETEKKQELGYSIAHYIYDQGMNVDIEYPIIYGMENKLYENNINQKINIDATAIILLHEDKDKIDSLDINCTVQSFDEKEIVITYEGGMNYKSTTTKKTTTSNNDGSTNKSTTKKSSNVTSDPNYDTYGGYTGGSSAAGNNNYDTYNGAQNFTPSQSQQAPIQNNNYDNYAPISGQNNVNMSPGSGDALIKGFASTMATSKKIFYTSTIDFDDCKDVYLSQYAIVSELAKYALSDDCEFANIDESKVDSVKKYIRKSSQTTIQSILQNADYQNKGLTSWPKSFSYKKNNYIYFTLPVSSELGDYAIVRYQYYEK